MKRPSPKEFTGFAIFLACCLLIVGCGTTRKIAGKVTPGFLRQGDSLGKKIAFLPAADGSHLGGDGLQHGGSTPLEAHVRDTCSKARVPDSQNVRRALCQMQQPPSGELDLFALYKLGRVFGLHGVVQEEIQGLEAIKEKRGVYGFRRMRPVLQISVRVRLYDVETATLILDEMVREDMVVPEETWQAVQSGQAYDRNVVSRLLAKATPGSAEVICEALGKEYWKGYIVASSDNRYTISAGADVGLSQENVLEVFGVDKPVQGREGRSYLLSGPKIGEIKIVEVQADRAMGVALSGNDLEKSSCVKLKRKD